MNREIHVRICGRLGAKFPGPTRQGCGATRPPMPIALIMPEHADGDNERGHPFTAQKNARSLRRGICGRLGRGRRYLNLNNIVLDRIYHQITDRVNVEFAHDIAAMCFRGLGT
jgi:hypothetical protein